MSKTVVIFLISAISLISVALAATMIDPSDCTEFPCTIFEDEFEILDEDYWEHEWTMSGGGNGEFEVYVNNRSNSYAYNGILYIKPGLVNEWKANPVFVEEEELDIWGLNGRNQACTGPAWDGCRKAGTETSIVNPVTSARIRTLGRFSFKYGSLEVRAKLPRGDWLWPAIWLLPDSFPYGDWPASGEIDIVEARGNDNYGDMNNTFAGSTLHWGPYLELNRYPMTHNEYQNSDGEPFPDDFHVWNMTWTNTSMEFYLDGDLVLEVAPNTTFWDMGNFPDVDNPWRGGEKMAPFDKKFYIVMNIAIGGTGGYFPDGVPGVDKPWNNEDPYAMNEFWNARDEWLPTWYQNDTRISEGAALQVDYIRIKKMVDENM